MNKLNVQEYLSLGYLYLLVLGLVTDTIYYGFLDINILDYSSISDVLISPLKLLARNKIVFFALVIIVVLLYAYSKWIHPRLSKAASKGKEVKVLTREKLIGMTALMVVGYFLGIGIGLGSKTKKELEKGITRQDHQITFSNYKSLNVKVVGRNSLYIFYVLKGGKEVICSPIDGNVVAIRKIH